MQASPITAHMPPTPGLTQTLKTHLGYRTHWPTHSKKEKLSETFVQCAGSRIFHSLRKSLKRNYQGCRCFTRASEQALCVEFRLCMIFHTALPFFQTGDSQIYFIIHGRRSQSIIHLACLSSDRLSLPESISGKRQSTAPPPRPQIFLHLPRHLLKSKTCFLHA